MAWSLQQVIEKFTVRLQTDEWLRKYEYIEMGFSIDLKMEKKLSWLIILEVRKMKKTMNASKWHVDRWAKVGPRMRVFWGGPQVFIVQNAVWRDPTQTLATKNCSWWSCFSQKGNRAIRPMGVSVGKKDRRRRQTQIMCGKSKSN